MAGNTRGVFVPPVRMVVIRAWANDRDGNGPGHEILPVVALEWSRVAGEDTRYDPVIVDGCDGVRVMPPDEFKYAGCVLYVCPWDAAGDEFALKPVWELAERQAVKSLKAINDELG